MININKIKIFAFTFFETSKTLNTMKYENNENNENKYYIYILECNNNILYTGVTTDILRRFKEHSKIGGSKKGAKFTKGHKPVKYVAIWKTDTRSDAQKLEFRIKQLDKFDKLLLISSNRYFKIYFNDFLVIDKYKRVRLSKKIYKYYNN